MSNIILHELLIDAPQKSVDVTVNSEGRDVVARICHFRLRISCHVAPCQTVDVG